MRLFVGLALSDAVSGQLSALRAGLGEVRWVPRQNLHLTLRFIGETSGADADDVHTALNALRGEPFPLTLKGLGSFSSANRVRAVWVGVAPSTPLQRLAAKVDRALVSCGQAPRKRKFLPHVTLARSKRIAAGRLEVFFAEHGEFQSAPFKVNEFILYRSHLLADGPVYEPIGEYPLSPGAQAGNLRGVENLAESKNV